MRISPLMFQYNPKKTQNTQTKFERNNTSLNNLSRAPRHQYTGVASADLAYASLFDNAIARDLKLMGLI